MSKDEEQIDIGKWAGDIIGLMIEFANHWNDNAVIHPFGFPKTLTRGDWDEQFNSFQERKRRA